MRGRVESPCPSGAASPREPHGSSSKLVLLGFYGAFITYAGLSMSLAAGDQLGLQPFSAALRVRPEVLAH